MRIKVTGEVVTLNSSKRVPDLATSDSFFCGTWKTIGAGCIEVNITEPGVSDSKGKTMDFWHCFFGINCDPTCVARSFWNRRMSINFV